MKYLPLTLFTIISLNLFFAGCKKEKSGRLIELNYVDTDTIVKPKVAGPLRFTIYIGSITGDLAKGATVKLAYSFDSVNNEQYFISKLTNDSGYVVFNDLPVDSITRKKAYYANAYLTIGNDELSTLNGNGSNGPLEIRLTQEQKAERNLVVTYK